MNIKITVPVSELENPKSFFGQDNYKQFVVENESHTKEIDKIKVVETITKLLPNEILRNVMMVSLINIQKGFDIEWLTNINEPWIEFPIKSFNPLFINDERLKNDTHIIMPMYSVDATGERLNGFITKDEIIGFMDEYKNDSNDDDEEDTTSEGDPYHFGDIYSGTIEEEIARYGNQGTVA